MWLCAVAVGLILQASEGGGAGSRCTRYFATHSTLTAAVGLSNARLKNLWDCGPRWVLYPLAVPHGGRSSAAAKGARVAPRAGGGGWRRAGACD